MKKKILAVLGSALVLAACESGPDQNVDVGSAATPGSSEDFRRNVRDRVFFAYNNSHLTPGAKKDIDSQVAWLKTYASTHAVVEGHCDDRGTAEFNLALGSKRAHAVKHALVHKGISKKRLKTISFGKSKPPVAGTGEAVWAQNRTAITVVQ
jgi:peptidoglycan-associated lipoprotein